MAGSTKSAKRDPGPTSGIGRRRAAALSGGNPEYELRRAEALSAATEVIRKKGYHRTRLAEISERMGGDRATLYYYFSSKGDLFAALVSEAVLHFTLRVEEICGSGESPLGRIGQVVRLAVVSFDRYPALSVFALEDQRTLEDEPSFRELGELNRRQLTAIRGVVDEGIADGSIALMSSQVATLMVAGGMNWVNRWYQPGQKITNEELADMTVRFVIDGLVGRAGA